MTMFDLGELAKWDEVLAALANGVPLRETAPRRDEPKSQSAQRCPMHEGARA